MDTPSWLHSYPFKSRIDSIEVRVKKDDNGYITPGSKLNWHDTILLESRMVCR
jgi:hypothetical protein